MNNKEIPSHYISKIVDKNSSAIYLVVSCKTHKAIFKDKQLSTVVQKIDCKELHD